MTDTLSGAELLRRAGQLLAAGEHDAALKAAESALQAAGPHPAVLAMLGQVELACGRAADAKEWFDRALANAPSDARLLVNRAAAFLALGDAGSAAQDAQAAVKISPSSYGAWLNLALALEAMDRPAEGLQAFEQAAQLRPHELSALRGRARCTYAAGGAHRQARALLEAVLARDPGDGIARLLLANSLLDDAEIDACLVELRALWEGQPHFHQAHSAYLIALQHHPDTTEAELFAAHREWARRHAPEARTWPARARPGQRLRIGWLSSRFAEGPLATLVLPAMEALATDCEHVLYASHPLRGEIGGRFARVASAVVNLAGSSPDAIAARIAEDGLDVLFDLVGHAPGNALRALARHPAPLQVLWGDYFCTSGLDATDLFLSDEVSTPAASEPAFVEQVERLPRGRFCYRPTHDWPVPAPRDGRRITFACFNRVSKLGTAVLAAWARILAQVPESRLQLRAGAFDDPRGRDFFLARAAQAGLAPDRLDLHGFRPAAEVFDAYAEVDIALDPFPFSGLVTSADALWMGVPVVTCRGQTLVGRQSASLLASIGLHELVATDVDGYVASAVALARDAGWRGRLRVELRERMQVALDPQPWARDLLGLLRARIARR